MPERRRAATLALSFLAFVALGLPDGLLGVAWPSIRASFGLRPEALGSLLAPFAASYVASSFAAGAILARMTVGSLLGLSCLATGLSLFGYAVAPIWVAMIGFAALAGLGAGAIDAAVNAHVSAHHGPRALNWMHAAYGVGAASGPIVMTAILVADRPWQWGYAIVGLGQLVLAAFFAASLSLWPPPRRDAGEPAASIAASLALRSVWLGIAAFFVYTGLEAVAGVWAYSYLIDVRGLSMKAAGLGVTIYWANLTIGRILFGAFVSVQTVATLLRGVLAAIVLAAAVLCLSSSAATGIAALGFLGLACGPVFPSLMSRTPSRVGAAHAENAIGFQVAAAAFGQSLLPTLVGRWSRGSGYEVVAIALLAAAIVLMLLHEWTIAVARERSRARAESAAPDARGVGEL